MADNRPCKAELLDWINTVSFVCDDTKLFLDTHPCNTEALEFYEEFKNQRMQALQEYAKYYGPLTLDTMCTPISGNGLIHRGRGRKEGASLCGIMKKDYSIR